jgi:hypothetical protein
MDLKNRTEGRGMNFYGSGWGNYAGCFEHSNELACHKRRRIS